MDRHTGIAVGLCNNACAECRRFQHSAVDVLRPCLQIQAKEHARQPGISQTGFIAVKPVQTDQTCFAGREFLRQLRKVLLHGQPQFFSFSLILAGNTVVCKPLQTIPHTGLTGGIAPQPRKKRIRQTGGDTADRALFLAEQHDAGGSPKNHHHHARVIDAKRRHGCVGIHMPG